MYGAIEKGKHVITANKALLAEFLPEIEAKIAEHKVQMGYEAAVCGGSRGGGGRISLVRLFYCRS